MKAIIVQQINSLVGSSLIDGEKLELTLVDDNSMQSSIVPEAESDRKRCVIEVVSIKVSICEFR